MSRKLLLVAALLTVGCDNQTQKDFMDEHYTQRVCAGVWRDFYERNPDCEARRGPKLGGNP